MAQVQPNPAVTPEYVNTYNTRLQNPSTTEINNPADLAGLVNEFPWLKGVKLVNKSASSSNDVPSKEVSTLDTHITSEPRGLDSTEMPQRPHDTPLSSEVAVHENPQAGSLWRTFSNSVSDIRHGTTSQEPHAVQQLAQVLVPESNSSWYVSDHTQQAKHPFFNASTHICPPRHLTVVQGAHSSREHDFPPINAPHGVFPSQQTAPYYFNKENLGCSPQHAPIGPEYKTGTPLHAGDHTQQTKPHFFNLCTQACPPMPLAVQQGVMGSKRHESFPSHAPHGQLLPQQTNPYYFNANNHFCSPHGPTFRYGGQESIFEMAHAPYLVTQGPHTPTNDSIMACPLTQPLGPSVSKGNLANFIPVSPKQIDKHGGQDVVPAVVTHAHGDCLPPAPSLNPNSASKDTRSSPYQTAEFSSQSQSGGQAALPQNLPPTYAHVVRPPSHTSDVITPFKKGEYQVVSIDDNLYHRQVEKCKQSFIGKITYSLGDKPHPLLNLKNRLKETWKINGDFRIVPLGKGYFNISFDSLEDRKQVGARSRWTISPGILRLSPWTPGFNPYKLNSSNAQVWLRIYELPFEFWHTSVIMGIAKAVGTPIKIDDRSLDGSVGHYVRVLVEVDLATPLHTEVMVDGPEYCDLVHLQFENLPPFCPNCKLVGHLVTNCFKLNRKEEEQVFQTKAQPKSATINFSSKSPQRERGRGRQRSRSRPAIREGDKPYENETAKDPHQPTIVANIVTCNTFEALAEPECNPKEDINDESVNQAVVERKNDNCPLQNPHRSEEGNNSNNAKSLAHDSSALVPYVQTVPKSILKKPRELPGTRVLEKEERDRGPNGRFQVRSWADMAEDSLDFQYEASHNPFEVNEEESSRTTGTQSDFIFSSSTQAIVDLVRSKAATNFSVKQPSTSAAQAMRAMVTKKWSSGNGG